MDFDALDLVVENYSLRECIYWLIGHLCFWSVSAMYLDQVFPNEFGHKKHPLFFLPFQKTIKKVTPFVKADQQ